MMNIEPGIYQDLSNKDYHAHKESISRSAIMDFNKSAYTYWAKHINPERPESKVTSAMELGTAFHTLILEPHLFDKMYAIEPTKVLLKDVGRDNYELYKQKLAELESKNKTVLTFETMEKLLAMSKSLTSHEKAMAFILDGKYEQSYFWIDEHSGLMAKARPDILHANIIVDLKTCDDASPRAFQRAMAESGYHVQGAMVQEGIRKLEEREVSNVVNVCVETKYPYSIGIYPIDESALEAGYVKFKQALLEIKHAKENNDYPHYLTQTISLPVWAA